LGGSFDGVGDPDAPRAREVAVDKQLPAPFYGQS